MLCIANYDHIELHIHEKLYIFKDENAHYHVVPCELHVHGTVLAFQCLPYIDSYLMVRLAFFIKSSLQH